MDREVTTITIDNHTFAVKTYATAREVAAIQNVYFKGARLEMVGDQPKISEFNANVQYEVKVEMVRQLVTSFDGDASNIVERAQDLPDEQFQQLAEALDAIASKKKRK